MKEKFIVFYDWDGTLIDSLPAHVKFIRDMNKEYKCGASLPDPRDTVECKKLVDTSSMGAFIIRAGLPKELVPTVLDSYVQEFGKNPRYRSRLFPGVSDMIKNLAERGIEQGILSANYRQNFKPILEKEDLLRFIYPIGDRVELDKFHFGEKAQYLKFYKGDNALSPNEIVYVADTTEDYEASLAAEVPFVGVSYGWRFSPGQYTPFPLADDIPDLENKLIGLSKQ